MLLTEPIAPHYYGSPGEPLGPDNSDSFDTDAIIRFIRRYWRVCLIWLLGGLCAGMAYAMLSPAHYTAFASVLLEDNTSRSAGPAPNGTEAAHSTYIDTQVQIFQSDEVVGRVVDKNHLTKDEEFGRTGGGLRVLIRSLLGFGSAAADREPRHATIVSVRRAVSVRRVGMSDVAEIGFTSRNPSRSAEIVNAIIQSYIDGRLILARSVHDDTASYLQERLADLREKAFPVEPPEDPSAATPEHGQQARARFREQQVRIETYRTLYDRLLQRIYGDTDAQFSSPGVRVITPAEPPLFASSRLLFVLVFAAVGGVSGIGHALLRELRDDGLRTVQDVKRLTDLDRVFGIPKIETQAPDAGESLPGLLQPAYMFVSACLHDAMGKVAARLQEGQNRRSGWIIGVAAPADGTGVSSVAAHLARVIADSGKKTLLLDANWRQSSIGQALLNSNQSRRLARGLTTINLEAGKLDVLVLRATSPTSELNALLSIVSTLELLCADYDRIVVDFHSSEQTADLAASMTVIDEVIVVAESRRTTLDCLRRLLQELPRSKIAAVILNKA